MKKTVFLLLVALAFPLFAKEAELTNHSRIKEMSSFTIMGEMELRAEKNIDAPVKYKTLNHEGGMKVRVLEILKNEKGGMWLYVLLTSPMWVDNGDWIEKYQKFVIFQPADMTVFDFEEKEKEILCKNGGKNGLDYRK